MKRQRIVKETITMKKRPNTDDSDEFDVDEPEEFEESGSDWDPEDASESKKRKIRSKAPGKKANKKKKIEKPPSEDEEEEENEDEEEDEEEEDEDAEEEDESEEECAGPEQTNAVNADEATTPDISIKAFTNGSFVVLKSDFKSKEDPPLWKIDGKALLQKYIPFDLDGRTVYKNTSTYSGWTPSNQNQYAAAPVTYVQQGKKVIIVEFNKDKVKLGDESNEAKKEAPETVDA